MCACVNYSLNEFVYSCTSPLSRKIGMLFLVWSPIFLFSSILFAIDPYRDRPIVNVTWTSREINTSDLGGLDHNNHSTITTDSESNITEKITPVTSTLTQSDRARIGRRFFALFGTETGIFLIGCVLYFRTLIAVSIRQVWHHFSVQEGTIQRDDSNNTLPRTGYEILARDEGSNLI